MDGACRSGLPEDSTFWPIGLGVAARNSDARFGPVRPVELITPPATFITTTTKQGCCFVFLLIFLLFWSKVQSASNRHSHQETLMKNLLLWITGVNLIRSTATKCGHRVWIFQNDEYCPDCLKQMTVPCAWCGRPIFIDDPITLYRKLSDYRTIENSVALPHDSSRWVGCMRMDCAESAADRAGMWVPGENGKGEVFRLPTPLEIIFSNPDAQMVSIPNLSNPDTFVVHKKDTTEESGKLY